MWREPFGAVTEKPSWICQRIITWAAVLPCAAPISFNTGSRKVSPDDKNFLNIATAIMVGHLKSHPEDMELVTAAFDERSIPMEVLAMQSQKQ